MDIGLFNKVNLVIDYYKKNTTSLLLNRPILAVSGFNTLGQNIGEMENSGIEVGINATPISSANGLNWVSDFNISFNRNKVVSLSSDVLPFGVGEYVVYRFRLSAVIVQPRTRVYLVLLNHYYV
ncbi:MAG: hypothetical protein ACKPFK_00755, partial [Dolichospermum sp.]